MCLSVRNLFQKLAAAEIFAVSSGQMFTWVIGRGSQEPEKGSGLACLLKFSLGSGSTFIFRKQKLLS